MKRLFVAVCLCLGLSATLRSQDTPNETVPAQQAVPEETVEGFWSVMGYFGGKLTSELGNRLNLTKQEEDQGVPTKVKLKLGSLEFVRTDNRKSSGR